ncbi:hypothetical protein C0J52_12001, partial [Blattella germanica]
LQCLLYIKKNYTDFTLRGNIHYHDTRSSHLINTNLSCYTTTQHNFNYMSIKLYNSLSRFAKSLEYGNFKCFIKNNMLYDQCFYNLEEYFQYVSNLGN